MTPEMMTPDLPIRATVIEHQSHAKPHPLVRRTDGVEQENALLLRLLSESQATVSRLTSRLKQLEAELAALEGDARYHPARTPIFAGLLGTIYGVHPRVAAIVRRADAARDEQNWAEAAKLYEQAVAANPRNGPIWVQLGNMRKDAGYLDLAAQAYEEAAFRMPE